MLANATSIMTIKSLLLSIVMLSTFIHNAHAASDSLGFRPAIYGNSGGVREFLRDAIGLLPAPDSLVEIDGKVFVGFTVDEQGAVCDVRVLRSLHPMYDSIAVAGVRAAAARTPWQPQQRNGHAERCSLSMPIAFRVSATPPPLEVYIDPEQMPIYGQNGGINEFVADVQQNLQHTDTIRYSSVTFGMIINTLGQIEQLESVTKNADPQFLKAVEEAIGSLKTRWTPGRQDGKPVNTKLGFTISSKEFPNKPWDKEPLFDGEKDFSSSITKLRYEVQMAARYPDAAGYRITGKVYIYIEFDEKGELKEIMAKRSPDPLLTKAAIRAVKKVLSKKKWTPAMSDNKPIGFAISFPVAFYILD